MIFCCRWRRDDSATNGKGWDNKTVVEQDAVNGPRKQISAGSLSRRGWGLNVESSGEKRRIDAGGVRLCMCRHAQCYE